MILDNFTRKALRYNTTSRLVLYLGRGCNIDMVQKAKLSTINAGAMLAPLRFIYVDQDCCLHSLPSPRKIVRSTKARSRKR